MARRSSSSGEIQTRDRSSVCRFRRPTLLMDSNSGSITLRTRLIRLQREVYRLLRKLPRRRRHPGSLIINDRRYDRLPLNSRRATDLTSSTVISSQYMSSSSSSFIVSAYRYIAITNLPIIPVFVEYLGHFLIDFNQIYRHSSVPKTRLRAFFELFSPSGFRARRRRDFFCHVVRTTV